MAIETGVLATGHPFARIGSGPHEVVYLPGLSFTHEPKTPKAVARAWKAWREPIERHGLTMVEIGRRPDLPSGSTTADIADDYAAVVRTAFDGPVGVMGISTGGGYAMWLAIRHPELVERLVLGFTAHRLTDEVRRDQRTAVEHFLAGRWRSGCAMFGPWAMPAHPRLASAAMWLVGPYVLGRYDDLRVLAIDADADETHDASARLGDLRAPTLVASGGRDTAYPPVLVRELVAALPDVRHVEYPRSSHLGPGRPFADDACAFLGGAT